MINVIVVRVRQEGDTLIFSQKEQLINPKESNFKDILQKSLPKGKICAVSLKSVFPGHAMKILDEDAGPKQKRDMQNLPCWTIGDLGFNIYGDAVIYGVEASERSSVKISIRDLVPLTTKGL